MKQKTVFQTIDFIPSGFERAFRQESKANFEFMNDYVKQADIKLGAFVKDKLVGFFCAVSHPHPHQEYSDLIEITAIYVRPEYRRRKILHKGVFWFINEAKKRRLKGILIWGMSRNTQKFFVRQAQSERRQRDKLSFKIQPLKGTIFAHGKIFFQRNPNRLKIKRPI